MVGVISCLISQYITTGVCVGRWGVVCRCAAQGVTSEFANDAEEDDESDEDFGF